MKPDKSTERGALGHGEEARTYVNRGRILIVEPDPLRQWSLKTYLGRWFSVDATDSTANAQEILEAGLVDALIVSEGLPPTALVSLEQRAHSLNVRIAIARIATDSSRPCRPGLQLACLDKPFELAQVARLLGIYENEPPCE